MPLNKLTETGSADNRDQVETILETALVKALQSTLAKTKNACQQGLSRGLTAAAAVPEPLPDATDLVTLGEVSGWWQESVDAEVVRAVDEAWRAGYAGYVVDGIEVSSTLDRGAEFIAAVRDRLVRGIQPPIAEDAFDFVREAIASGSALGWSRSETARRIALDLGWSVDRPYWEGIKRNAYGEIDAILDPLGPPGSTLREEAKANDPRIRALQAEANRATKRLDADEAYWSTRANRIARTEATAANGYAALGALHDEGATHKQWISSHDMRTRETHREANGQVVEVGQPFNIGGYLLQFPGDPNGPAEIVINCRCTIISTEQFVPIEEGNDSPDGPGESVPTDEELLSDPRKLKALSTDELDAMTERLMQAGDWDALDRLSEEMARREVLEELGLTPNILANPYQPSTFDWFATLDEDAQDRALESMRENAVTFDPDQFLARQWAHVTGRSAERALSAGLPKEREIKAQWKEHVRVLALELDEVTRGQFVKAQYRLKGISAEDLYSVNERTARKWASEETLAHWQQHGRPTYASFKESILGGSTAAREAANDEYWL